MTSDRKAFMRPSTTRCESLHDSDLADRRAAVRTDSPSSPRGRLIAALVECVEEKGYPATTLGDIVAAARVSRSTFYEHFTNKEHCFVESVHTGIAILAQRVRAALGRLPREADPRVRIACVITTFCDAVADEPRFARMVLVESARVERAATAVRVLAMDPITEMYRHFHARARAVDPLVPPVSSELIALIPDAISERTRRVMLTEGAHAVPASAPLFIAFTTAVLGMD
ncbi:TetR/AcrR family transcriptional regulator [Nocardia shimofusensis]|uniref:TetR/AcrR family transcriptional regulator n=1 Tax=Nocardia shimofusensis TaxID=228596 RepID=UPI001FDEF8F8|nr:TetR/AcrR family transcriptional regulator [Nocardia shimofusensis]